MWVIAYLHDAASRGWYVVDMINTNRVLSGPYDDHADAVEAVKTRSHRLAQGWEP